MPTNLSMPTYFSLTTGFRIALLFLLHRGALHTCPGSATITVPDLKCPGPLRCLGPIWPHRGRRVRTCGVLGLYGPTEAGGVPDLWSLGPVCRHRGRRVPDLRSLGLNGSTEAGGGPDLGSPGPVWPHRGRRGAGPVESWTCMALGLGCPRPPSGQ